MHEYCQNTSCTEQIQRGKEDLVQGYSNREARTQSELKFTEKEKGWRIFKS